MVEEGEEKEDAEEEKEDAEEEKRSTTCLTKKGTSSLVRRRSKPVNKLGKSHLPFLAFLSLCFGWVD